ncbi:hypothetical protein GRJ2_000221900 [Grus japonensis]|uniref:Uncharacterized protein n=1 Tax=Grus japonensis TaxID=30415 RepID=A0ABC9VVY7_GRUJA
MEEEKELCVPIIKISGGDLPTDVSKDDEANSGNEDDSPLADNHKNMKQYETLPEAFEDSASQRCSKAEVYEIQHMLEMHQRDLLGERQDDGMHLEKAFEGLHSILLHPEDAIGDNHSGYAVVLLSSHPIYCKIGN